MKTDASKRLYAINGRSLPLSSSRPRRRIADRQPPSHTDYARTRKALDSCLLCPKDEDGPPRAAVIAMGTRAYLACTQTEELVDGHVIIVPLQHTLTSLEGDDDVWDEIRVSFCSIWSRLFPFRLADDDLYVSMPHQNFMKCLMKMFAEQDKGVIFYETVLSFKQQKHTYIEA